MSMHGFGPEGDAAYIAALREGLNGSEKPTDDTVRRTIREMDRAATDGESWPEQVRAAALKRFLFNAQKSLLKSDNPMRVSGRETTSVVGALTDGGWTQKQLTLFDWDELRARLNVERQAAQSRLENAAIYARLLQLEELVPEAKNVGQALAALGVELESWLNAEESA